MTKLRLFDSYAFYTSGIVNFGPLYVKLNFDSKSDSKTPLNEVYVALLACASVQGVMLLTCNYADENEPSLTPNHMFYGRALTLCDPETRPDVSKMLLPSKINNIENHFRDRWKKEYLVNLREDQKIKHPNKYQQIVNVKDIVKVQEDKIPRSVWKVGITEEVIKGTDEMVIFEEQ